MAENPQLQPPLGMPAVGFGARPDQSRPPSLARRSPRSLLAGGTDGNELLTVQTGAVLLVLLAVLGVTILLIHKVVFFVWLAATSLHVLGHLPALRSGLLGARRERDDIIAAVSASAAGSLGAGPSPARRLLPARSGFPWRLSLTSRNLAVRVAGGPARGVALAGALLAGLALALALVPDFAPWLHYHRHHG